MRAALEGVDTLFLLNAAVPDEVTQALLTLDLAREAGVERIVYLSVFNSALFDDVPHFASKHLAERMIDAQTISRHGTTVSRVYAERSDVAGRAEGGCLPPSCCVASERPVRCPERRSILLVPTL